MIELYFNSDVEESEIVEGHQHVRFNLETTESYWESVGRGYVLGE